MHASYASLDIAGAPCERKVRHDIGGAICAEIAALRPNHSRDAALRRAGAERIDAGVGVAVTHVE